MTETALLEFRSVNTHYGAVHILKDVDLAIYPGEMVCLLGGNASGKSTTLKTLLGMVTPTAGALPGDYTQSHATETNLRARGDLLKVTVHAPSPSSDAHELASAVEHADKADLAVVPLEQGVARAEGERLLVTLAGSLAPGGHLLIGLSLIHI